MANRYDTRNLHGLGGRSEELQTVMDLVESDMATKLSATEDASLTDGVDIAVGTSAGTKIGTATGQKLGFWGATPVVQQNHVADIAITATTGTLPTAADTQTIADAATPTVAELLALCVSLNAKVNALNALCASIGITKAS